YLDVDGLDSLFDIARNVMGVELGRIPISVETSPATAKQEKLALLKEHGVTRVSIGVQRFLEAETKAVARPQPPAVLEAAVERLRATAFPVLNVDLIYGLPGQTVNSWLASVEAALRYRPEELYLYPLYARPLTGLDRWNPQEPDLRLECYRE